MRVSFAKAIVWRAGIEAHVITKINTQYIDTTSRLQIGTTFAFPSAQAATHKRLGRGMPHCSLSLTVMTMGVCVPPIIPSTFGVLIWTQLHTRLVYGQSAHLSPMTRTLSSEEALNNVFFRLKKLSEQCSSNSINLCRSSLDSRGSLAQTSEKTQRKNILTENDTLLNDGIVLTRWPYWSLRKWVGNWVGLSNAKALGIVLRDRTDKNAKHHYKCSCLCSQVHCNCTAAAFLLVSARILPLQTIPSAIAVLIRTQLPVRVGNDQLDMAKYLNTKRHTS